MTESKDAEGVRRVGQALFDIGRRAVRRALRRFETHRDDIEPSSTWEVTIKVEEDPVDGGFIAECLELPGCMSQGETSAEALDNLVDALGGVLTARIHLALEASDESTEPRTDPPRTRQIAIPVG